MDNTPENIEKMKRVKEEIWKATKASTAEGKANLAHIDTRTFEMKKGLDNSNESYRYGCEKISSLSLILIILGVVADAIFFFVASHLQLGLADLLPSLIDNLIFVLFVVVPALLALFAIVEALVYLKRTGIKLSGPIATSITTIVVYLIWQSIRIYITSI